MLLPPLPGMRTLGMGMAGMAGMAVGGAFAVGVACGVAGVGAACLARRFLRGRNRWRDEDRIQGMPAAGPTPGDDGPQLPVGEAPVV
jgi:hypothetical protein